MPSYALFGGTLASAIEFPELPRAVGDPTWTLTVGPAAKSMVHLSPIGEDAVYGQVKVRCYRSEAGHQLAYDDTGCFDVQKDGLIAWHPPDERPSGQILDAARADVIGRVLAVAMHQTNVLSLHASAVSLSGAGIALLAPKMHGKSTLATALVRGGGRLLSDDTVPVSGDGAPRLRPGVHQLRLWKDSALQLAREQAGTMADARKLVLDDLSEAEVERETMPFAAAYVLVPEAPQAEEAVVRSPLTEVQATLALIEHSKLGPLLGGRDAALVFAQAAAIARVVPVFLLRVARDLDRLPAVVSTILEWHRT
jgi:hypothetical protein